MGHRSMVEDHFGGRTCAEDNSQKRAEKKTMVLAWNHMVPLGAFRGDKQVVPNRFPSPLKSESI
jgi:hypothetical protein